MQKQKMLSQIFEDEPSQWGLRGDPYLWAEMKNSLGNFAYPDTKEDLLALLEKTYEHLTGRSVKDQAPVFIERYSRGGMSGGHISPQFWMQTGLPLLLSKYRETK